MELKDLIVTPLLVFIVYALAYWVRPYVTDVDTRRYFIPALTVKIIGAIAVGLVYQFYYGGGDTFAYHTHGSRIVWEAFINDPVKGIKLLFHADITSGIYEYASRIWYYGDQKSYFIVQIASVFDLLTFSTYSATAVLFAVFSFSGVWVLFQTFYEQHKNIHLGLAIAILFVPTVFFWGSGILKDTVTLGCLGWATYSFYQLAIQRNYKLLQVFVFILSAWMIYSIKIYILLSLLPALLIWYYLSKIHEIRSFALRIIVAPVLFLVIGGLSYLAIEKVGEDDPRYRLDQLAETARMTAYDIRFGWGARQGVGSGYYLGELDGSFGSMIRLMPAAINVTLFRPYLWEVQNPFMLLSALESLGLFFFTLFVIFKVGPMNFFRLLSQPEVAFGLFFSIVFAFAVGISTYNFGSLSRYKIPLMPFYISALLMLYSYVKSDRKLSVLELAE